MRKALEALAFLSLFLLWSLSVVSIPFIPETCIICGCQEGPNAGEKLRTLSITEWLLDTVPDAHFTCFKYYDAEIHNPSGGF
tara:strand:+ start:277 stop:522 length:246 start_codon:yes stop_codon:yes gene_type:complete